MDPLWASALAGKDYIFPSDWNASFWLVNLSYLGVAAAIHLLEASAWTGKRRVRSDCWQAPQRCFACFWSRGR